MDKHYKRKQIITILIHPLTTKENKKSPKQMTKHKNHHELPIDFTHKHNYQDLKSSSLD